MAFLGKIPLLTWLLFLCVRSVGQLPTLQCCLILPKMH